MKSPVVYTTTLIATTVMFCNQIKIQRKKTYLTKWFIMQTIFKKVMLFAYEMTDIFLFRRITVL